MRKGLRMQVASATYRVIDGVRYPDHVRLSTFSLHTSQEHDERIPVTLHGVEKSEDGWYVVTTTYDLVERTTQTVSGPHTEQEAERMARRSSERERNANNRAAVETKTRDTLRTSRGRQVHVRRAM